MQSLDNAIDPFPQVSNFRDFGGYETADGRMMPKGLLFRSAHLGRIDEAGVARLGTLGIRTVIDLRGREERNKSLPTIDESAGVEIVSAPVEPGAFTSMILPDGRTVTAEIMRENIINTYRRFGREAAVGFGSALSTILDRSDAPLLVHCTAGKDRTGFTVALVQALLGVPQPTIIADYLLTNTLWDRAYDGSLRFPADIMAPALLAAEEYLMTALDIIEIEHGGIENFAELATGTPGFGEQLRGKLLQS